MYRLRTLAPLLLLLALLAQASAADHKKPKPDSKKLEHAIEQVLSNDPEIARGFWGIYAVALDTGKPLYALNADKLFTPASNTKLFTTAAVFGLIGPDYTFKTTVETIGDVDKYGRLNADLVIVGRGDPNLSGRTLPYSLRTERKAPPIQALTGLADQLVQRGLKYIDGDIVADDSYYVFERYGEGWSQDDLVREWGAPVSALTINDNLIFINIMPADHPGERAFLNITPFADYYHVDNRVMTTPQGTGPRTIYINREPGSNQLTFWGNIPQDDPGFGEALAIDDPAEFTAKAFRQLLQERGVVIYGKARTKHTELSSLQTFTVTSIASGGGTRSGVATPAPLVLASYQSQPVAQDLRVINKVSQNLHAELMLRLLGKEKGTSGSIEGGLEVLRGFLTTAGIKPEEFVFFDGSGLSRENLVTPDAIVTLLAYSQKQPWGRQYEATLPVAGIDGSLTDRFRNLPGASSIHAKTGSLSHVYSLSGYATTEKGERVAFSIMTNNGIASTKKTLDAIDRIVASLIDDK